MLGLVKPEVFFPAIDGEAVSLSFPYEEIEVLEIPFAEALQMMEQNKIIDAKTQLLLQYAQINKLLVC